MYWFATLRRIGVKGTRPLLIEMYSIRGFGLSFCDHVVHVIG